MKKIFLIITSVALIAGIGCKKGYLDVNTNPNQSTAADPGSVLPSALVATVAQWYPGPTAHSGWLASWAISGSFAISSTDFSTYKMTTDFGDGTWATTYDNLEDYQYIQDKSASTKLPFLEGVARVMKVYQFHHLVDLFNDIPYTDALKGPLSLRPTYTKGMVVYDSLFNELQKGITLIKNAGLTAAANSDVMFSGDKTKWIQFANTVRLRMLLRMSELTAKPAFFQTNLDLTKNETAGFLTEDALVQPGYSNSAGKGNPFWQRFYDLNGGAVSSFGDFWAPSKFAVSFYQTNNDPRLSREFAPLKNTTNTFVGNTLGLTNGNPVNGSYSLFGPGVLAGPGAPAVMMLAAESYFLQAEAAVLGYVPGDAQALYQQGITESFRYLGVPSFESAAMAYYSQAGNTQADFTTATTVLAKQTIILRQKWAALTSINSFEAYSDYRRFDYLHTGTPPYTGPLGNTPLSVSPFIDVPKIPLRYKYPTSEYSKNPENVGAEGAIDHQTGKIFWIR
ncbi:MAG: SusD/RagB family nutrient-binding outer membrane lipoprotein [Ferruginibacter sp.]